MYMYFLSGLLLVLCFFSAEAIAQEPTRPASTVPNQLFELTRFVPDEDEIKIVDKLITATEAQLQQQRRLKELMMQFQVQKEEFIQGKQTKMHTAKLVRLGREIYECIEQNQFKHLFAQDYLDELQFFASLAGKKSITRP